MGKFNRFTVSLSSTVPEMIRVTFVSKIRQTIIHRRVDISDKIPNTSNDGFMLSSPIKFNFYVLMLEIKNLLEHHNPSLIKQQYRPVSYGCNMDDSVNTLPYTVP